MLQSIRNLLLFIVIIAVLFVMKSLSSIMLPLVIAIMIVLMYEPLFHFLRRKKFPISLITPVLAVATIGVLFFVVQIFISSSQAIYNGRVELVERLQGKLDALSIYFDKLVEPVTAMFNIDMSPNTSFIDEWLQSNFTAEALENIFGSSISAISSFGSSFFMFALYFLILLFSMPGYDRYMKYIAGSDQKFKKHAENIQQSIGSYMTVKVFTSLITAVITLVICLLFGIWYAPFWAFVTFSLNFIPTFGSIIATSLPALMAVIQFDSPFKIIVFILLLFAVQMTIGNFVDPKIMGNRLRLNTITIIFGLVFWSYIWGIPGAFLSVPLLVIVKIFMQNNQSLVFISRIMGQPDK